MHEPALLEFANIYKWKTCWKCFKSVTHKSVFVFIAHLLWCKVIIYCIFLQCFISKQLYLHTLILRWCSFYVLQQNTEHYGNDQVRIDTLEFAMKTTKNADKLCKCKNYTQNRICCYFLYQNANKIKRTEFQSQPRFRFKVRFEISTTADENRRQECQFKSDKLDCLGLLFANCLTRNFWWLRQIA